MRVRAALVSLTMTCLGMESPSSVAATLEAQHRDFLVNGCVDTYSKMPAMPPGFADKIPAARFKDDPAKLKAFCTCHAETTFAEMNQADYLAYLKEMRSGMQGTATKKVGDQIHARAKIADASCPAKVAAGK